MSEQDARAALSSRAPDRLSEKEQKVVSRAKDYIENTSASLKTPLLFACVGLLAIIDRLSRQPEAEPVAFIDELTLTDFRDKGSAEYPRHGVVANNPIGPKKITLYTSPRLDREKVAALFENADEQDWSYLFSLIPDSGRGRFWKDRLTALRNFMRETR